MDVPGAGGHGWSVASVPACDYHHGSTLVGGRIRVQQVPWSKEAAYRLPVPVWREAIDAHFPNSAWIKMSRQTLEELQRFKSAHALPTWDLTLAALLKRAEDQS